MLPTFIVIGAMKCGTGSLYRYLDAHPEVSMSRTKETDFFVAEKNYDKGVDWYEAQFPEPAKARGEADGAYAKCHRFEGVPERMHELLPSIKLVYIVRDPIECRSGVEQNRRSKGVGAQRAVPERKRNASQATETHVHRFNP